MKRTPLKRKVRLRGTPRPTDPQVVAAVMRRSGGTCEVDGCARKAKHPHHRWMRSHGGPDSEANILAVCSTCHRRIHDSPAWAYKHGYLLRSWEAPARLLDNG